MLIAFKVIFWMLLFIGLSIAFDFKWVKKLNKFFKVDKKGGKNTKTV